MKGKLIFKETHGMSGSIIWYLTFITMIGVSGLFAWGMFQQLVMGNIWGDQPMSDLALLLVGTFTILLTVGIQVFLSFNQLTLEIDEKSIYVKFRPYFNQFKTFNHTDLQRAYVRKYKPIMEYGGWGIRIGLKKNKAYNISGNWGMQLVFADGSKLLIGTRRPKELEEALQKFKVDG